MAEQEIYKKRPKITFLSVLYIITAVILLLAGTFLLLNPTDAPASKVSNLPPSQATPKAPSGPEVPTSLNMGMPKAASSIISLQAPLTAASEKHFTLVAQPAQLSIGSNKIAAWTFNGTAPGPTLRVRQGDLVFVTLVNHLSFGVTIHWHGIRVPNAGDGVAGVTQDAVKPGQSYVYRFTALDAGTYWYHSHQFSDVETSSGLFGMLIVD